MSEPVPWHRLFGLSLFDFFRNTTVRVDTEKDLSRTQQFLDVILVRTDGTEMSLQLPDGFEGLAAYNLITFKSHQEALDGWALNELVGHYVNYRKQESPSLDALLPESDFRLFAVCVRTPQKLSGSTTLATFQEGVYEVRHFSGVIRVIVVNELPRSSHNAILHLFSTDPDLVRYGSRHFELQSKDVSSVIKQLIDRYNEEGDLMSEVLEELMRQGHQRYLESIPAETRLEGIPPEKRLEGIPPEKRLEGIPPELIIAKLREQLSPEELAALLQQPSDEGKQAGSQPEADSEDKRD